MRVLEVLNQPPGETFLQQHAKALTEHAPDVELFWAFTQTNQNGRLIQFDFSKIKCYSWPNYNLYPKWKKILIKAKYLGKSLDALYGPQLNLLRKIKPDLVHFHFSSLAVKYAHLCIKLHIPYTFSIRGSDLHTLTFCNSENLTYIQKFTLVSDEAKAIHAVSNKLKESFLEITHSKNTPVIIPTTVDVSWKKINRKPEKGLLVSIGRLTWQKGFPDLILAMKTLIVDQKTARLVIIGDGPQRQELEYMIRDLGLTQHVSLVGKLSQDQIKQWFSRAEAFVLSSIAEGFPNVLVEAMLTGIPIVTSNCGGILEIINHQQHAFVYTAGNTSELALQLSQILSEINHTQMVVNARQLSENTFSYAKHASSFLELWK